MTRSERGFTLLEVLVAVSILGLGLTVILSSQASLFATSARGEKLTVATSLARCRMSETELDLLKTGYPLADESEEGECCNDESPDGFNCSWKIERVKLPEASLGGESDTDAGDSDELGALGKLTEVAQNPSAALGDNPDLGSLAQELGGGEGAQGMAPMLMGMVYPELKPMLEASIRKLTVSVAWKEGKNERSLKIVQYVTDPQQGELDSAVDGGT
ncbi:MAG TPA: type II secretion system protein [Polyangiaceae bacterium]|jgi:prepilin-type N-terminal cleavage/methylation domain-containing protein|nr:type II secretion system protein [Polyangiaceae bacterium]